MEAAQDMERRRAGPKAVPPPAPSLITKAQIISGSEAICSERLNHGVNQQPLRQYFKK